MGITHGLRKQRARLHLLLLLSRREFIVLEMDKPLPLFRKRQVLQRRVRRLEKNNHQILMAKLKLLKLQRLEYL